MTSLSLAFAGAFAWLAIFRGCAAPEGCLAGDDGKCTPQAPCQGLAYTCATPALELRRVESGADRASGPDALAATGDVLLRNDHLRLVLDGLGAPHFLSPSGGAVLDLSPVDARGDGDDGINQIFQAVGILPGDAVRATRIDLEDRSPRYVAAIVRGTLDGRPKVSVVTRYELRPCEPGVRVRTELFHGGDSPESFFLSDALYWGGRKSAPFTPLAGRGFVHPDLDLLELDRSFVEQPFFASRPERDGAPAYAVVACGDGKQGLSGFHSDSISAAGLPRTVVMPGDALAFERFFVVARGPGMGGAVSEALRAREQLFGEPTRAAHGRVRRPDGRPLTPADHASVLVYEPGPGGSPALDARTVWTEATLDAQGAYRVAVPAGKRLVAVAHALGRAASPPAAFTTLGDVEVPDLVSPEPGRLEARVVDSAGQPVRGELVLTPTRAEDVAAARGSLYGAFDVAHCAPYLGPPHGGSPACNRALLGTDGRVSLAVPAGRYWAYATEGPFSTLARAEITIADGATTTASLVVDKLPSLMPAGALSADFHVHGGASFDSSLPEIDRARSFVATGVDVLAATDHDVVSTYEAAIRELGIGDRVRVMPGAETTGHILFYRPPGSDIPKVVGHYNFWPLRYDAALPRNGLPWDELLEPGPLFDRVAASFDGAGVIQFNHPLAGSSFGRDEGFLTAIEFDARKPVPAEPSDVGPGQLRRSRGGRTALDYHVQEVMNGTSTRQFQQYRLAWFSLLNQGILRGGTANSDSHTLAVEVLGYARNLVLGGHTLRAFDVERFNADVRAGKMIGTNGPVIDANIEGRGPSLAPLRAAADAALSLEVRAAPWIPVEEIRVLVNGKVRRVLRGPELARPTDPFGRGGLVRFSGKLPVAELLAGLPADSDAWIVVEAGLPLFPSADLDRDGYPDTTDNNGDGVIDLDDRRGYGEDDAYVEPGRPSETDPRFHANVVAPGHWATAFTNPWLIDRGRDGWTAPGL